MTKRRRAAIILMISSLALLGSSLTRANAVTTSATGLKCDGKTDDTQALQAAITKARGASILLPAGTCSINGSINLNGHASLRGKSFRSTTLNLQGSIVVSGDSNSLAYLTVRRSTGTNEFVIVDLKASSGFLIDHVLIDGQKAKFGNSNVHGIRLNETSGGTIKNVAIRHSAFTGLDYGLFQSNDNKSTVDGFVVDSSLFTKNYMDDLEFNAPQGRMSHVTITNSKFLDTKAPPSNPAYGFGVGLANVQTATIKGNTFSGYPLVPLHIEDRSSNVLVANNLFKNSGTYAIDYSSDVFIINKSHDIVVQNNSFDSTPNKNKFVAVYASTGGGSGPPSNITVANNTFKLSSSSQKTGLYDAVNTSGNDVTK